MWAQLNVGFESTSDAFWHAFERFHLMMDLFDGGLTFYKSLRTGGTLPRPSERPTNWGSSGITSPCNWRCDSDISKPTLNRICCEAALPIEAERIDIN